MSSQRSTPPRSGSLSAAGSAATQQQPDLQWLEDKLAQEIDSTFFTEEEHFKPFIRVIEILATGLQAEQAVAASSGTATTDQQAVLAGNALYGDVKRQLDVCASVVESLTVEHHSSLNSSLKAMGAVAEHYNKTRSNVGKLREEVRECKALLQTGAHQADVRELWQRKAQYTQVLRLLDMLDMIKGATGKFDKLVRQRRFVAAVDLLNASLEAIFTRELVDVPAVASVRDDLLQRKGIILETIVRELADTLFLRTAAELSTGSGGVSARAVAVNRGAGRGSRGVAQINGSDSSSAVDGSYSGAGSRWAADGSSSRNAKPAVFVSFAGLQLDASDVSDDTERGLEDPASEFGAYMTLLVEAVRRLRAVHDIERHLLDKLCAEVDRLCAGHMQACAGVAGPGAGRGGLEGGLTVVGTTASISSSSGDQDQQHLSQDVTRLTRYLRAIFEAFVRVLHNHVYLVGLVQLAKKRDTAASAQPGRFADADSTIRCREDLPAAAWRHIQSHVITVLSRHLALPPPPMTPEAAAAAASSRERRGSGMVAAKGLVSLMRGGDRGDGTPPPSAGSKGGAAAAAEFDRERAAEFVRSCVLVKPSPVILISVFKHTLKFASMSQALLTALHKEATGQSVTTAGGSSSAPMTGISYNGSTSTTSTAAAAAARNGEAAKELKDFLHKCVQSSLLPYIAQKSAALHSRITSDPEAFLPFSIEPIKNTSAAAAAAAAGSSVRGAAAAGKSATAAAVAAQEALDRAIRSGAARPGKGAEAVQAHAALIFKAMVQIPSFTADISAALDSALESYYTVARDRFTEFCGQGAAYKRLVRSGDKLRELLRRDGQFAFYKRNQHGGRLPFEDSNRDPKTGAVTGSQFSPVRSVGAAAASAAAAVAAANKRSKLRAGLEGNSSSTAEEEGDDLFESELMLLDDHWRVNGTPITKEALLSPRKQQAVACLAFSCDWLVHKVLRMCAALDKEGAEAQRAKAGGDASNSLASSPTPAAAQQPAYAPMPQQHRAPAPQQPTLVSRGFGASAAKFMPGSKDAAAAAVAAQPPPPPAAPPATPAARLRAFAKKLSGLADDCALVLRLELYMEVSHHTAALTRVELSSSSSSAAVGLGGDDADACVVDLCRSLRDMQEALSPQSPKPGMGLVAPRDLFAYVISPLPRLLPRILVHCLAAAIARPVSAVGVGKAAKVVAALQQLVSDITETSGRYLLEGPALSQVITDKFSRAARYASLLGASHSELESYIRANRADFTKEEYRAQWLMKGMARRTDDRDQAAPFETWWASERF